MPIEKEEFEVDYKSYIFDYDVQLREEGIEKGIEKGVEIGPEILQALKANVPTSEIASKFNVSMQQVERYQMAM